jgi:uncharacterized membrane protein
MEGVMLVPIVHTVHVLAVGAWLGGVLFTTLVVSPALKAMKWREAERVGVRALIGHRYARVGGVNLVLLAVFAILDGIFGGFGASLYAEYVLLPVLVGVVAAHGAFFGRRVAALAESERGSTDAEEAASFAQRRRSLQRLSLKVSWVNLAVSTTVAALAANA